jgi:oligopeptide transport system substrate-binding protein
MFFLSLLYYKIKSMRVLLISVFALAALLISSCSGSEQNVEDLVAKGGKKYGGEFKFMSSEKIKTLFPTYNTDLYSNRIISQIFEPILTINPKTFDVSPGVAESWTVSDDAKVYTLKIRKGIKFHNDDCFSEEGHELNAEDVKFTLDIACSGLKKNQISYLLINKIKGAKEFFEKSTTSLPKSGVSGVKIIDDYTIEITLVNSFAGFESILTHGSLGVSPREAFDKYGDDIEKHPVGSGPFQLATFENDKIELIRNPNYWQKDEFGNQLPFLGKITLTYSKDKKSELLAFRKEQIDMVLQLPVEEIEHILGSLQDAQDGKNVKHKVDSESSLSVMYIGMACESDEFKDARVRKAFNLAIDRNVIVDEWLEGEGWAATNGFVPTMNNYPNESVKGHTYNVQKAQSLMKEAGHANGADFPALDFYVNALEGSAVHKFCKAVASQLKANLNVTLNIKLCSLAERENAIASGKAKIWRSGWIADYPDAENFLALFYTGRVKHNSSSMNSFNFHNATFDQIYEQALSESDSDKRALLLAKCDQIVIDEAAVMPILTNDHIVMLNARVRDFEANPMESINLTRVFIKEARK